MKLTRMILSGLLAALLLIPCAVAFADTEPADETEPLQTVSAEASSEAEPGRRQGLKNGLVKEIGRAHV